MKNTGSIYKGPAKSKANVTIILSDDTFQQLADGKVSYLLTGVVAVPLTLLKHTAGRPEGVHEWQAQDKGQHDVRDQA